MTLPSVQLLVGRRDRARRQPEHRVERGHWVEAPIEAENVLVEVGLQVLRAHPMVRSREPRLQVREDQVDHRQVRVGPCRISPQYDLVVPVAEVRERVVPVPPVRGHGRALGHVLRHEVGQRRAFAVRDHREPNAARVGGAADGLPVPMLLAPLGAPIFGRLPRPDLYCADHEDLVVDAAPLATGLPTYEGLVHLDRVLHADGLSVRAEHSRPELVEDLEGGLVPPQPKLTLELERGLPRGLSGREVGTPEPSRQRRVGALHDSAGGQGDVGLAGSATQHDRRALGEAVRLSTHVALRTGEPVRPAELFQVDCTGGVGRKDTLEFRQGSRKASGIHALSYGSGSGTFPRFGNKPDRHGFSL